MPRLCGFPVHGTDHSVWGGGGEKRVANRHVVKCPQGWVPGCCCSARMQWRRRMSAWGASEHAAGAGGGSSQVGWLRSEGEGAWSWSGRLRNGAYGPWCRDARVGPIPHLQSDTCEPSGMRASGPRTTLCTSVPSGHSQSTFCQAVDSSLRGRMYTCSWQDAAA